MGQRNAQRAAMKSKRHAERKRADRIERTIDSARETVGLELVKVRESLARREAEAAQRMGPEDPAVVGRLRQENTELREDLAHALQVSRQLREERVEERRLSNELTDEVEHYQAVARRMKIKSEAMFTVFAHWNVLTSWLFDAKHGRGESEEEQVMLDFWQWMHQHQGHLFRAGHIETSYEDELIEEEEAA